MKLRITLGAILRSTPSMLIFRVKRIVRDRTVSRFARRYEARCRALADSLPPVTVGAHRQSASLFVSRFYSVPLDRALDAGAGRLILLEDEVDFGSATAIDWTTRRPSEVTHFMWRMKLSQMGVLHTLLKSGTSDADDAALTLIRSFSEAASFVAPEAFKVFWSPYEISHRLLAIVSGLDLRPRSAPLPLGMERELSDFIAFNAAVLLRNLELELMNNHTERNLAALTMYFASTGSEVPARIGRLIRKVLKLTMLSDGMQIERSAMYQCLSLMSLEIFASSSALRPQVRDEASKVLNKARAALGVLTHEDGDIALFNDSWIGEAPPSAQLLPQVPSHAGWLPDAGYARLGSPAITAFVDVGPLGPRWNPGHGHDDALSIEVDIRGERFIVDPGTTTYDAGPERDSQRSASSHNGPHVHGVASALFDGSFRVERLPPRPRIDEIDLARGRLQASARVSTGRVARGIDVAGEQMLVRDSWTRFKDKECETALLIPGGWTVSADQTSILCRKGALATRIDVVVGTIVGVEAGTWSRRFKVREVASIVRLAPVSDGHNCSTLVWSVQEVTRL